MIQLQVITKLLLLKIVFAECLELIVNTAQGQLRGREFKSRNGRKVAAFSGIPFAKPPLGPLRFQDPQPPESWTRIRDAYNFGSVCVHIPFLYPPVKTTKLGNEDCLYLSVYTPTLKPPQLLPVIFYIYGGGFSMGSGEIDKSPEYFMDHDVVIVMPNYRLGPLGFISMEDNIMAGNMGMKDQVMALVWVRKNIANFGGDPDQVTLIGESAGGASAHYHMYSPMSRGLFHKAVSQSGTAVSCWVTVPPGVARSQAIHLAKQLNCSVNSSQMILDCLKTKNAYEMVELYTEYVTGDETDYNMLPIIDTNSSNPFIPFDPQTSEPAPLPWIIGTVSIEGSGQSGDYFRNSSALADLNQNFDEKAPGLLQYKETSLNPDKITKKIREYYFDGQQITLDLFKNISDMFGDRRNSAVPTALKLHKGPHYLYYFDYEVEHSYQEILFGKKVLRGAAHLDDATLIWRYKNPIAIPPSTTSSDLNVSHILLKLIVNFVYSGNPTPDGSDFSWPRWDKQQQNFISFENKGITHNSKFLPERMQFWASLHTNDKFVEPAE
ncbi:venom carboxylesterase-6-like isoform X1 [Rhodnius prolixus]|uniref:venom carboxylesterase-6-like isoform X1 n=1 Tax=Rhodnius prolixus TaxID=13249 RepID=UPI003D18DBFC